jgi:uncharacterized phage-like protein YoqJ
MKTLISGHRLAKLKNYDISWIEESIETIVQLHPNIIGLSGMADGIDLLFCDILYRNNCGYHCYIPFVEQDEYMSDLDKQRRATIIKNAHIVFEAKNSKMVEDCQSGIIVWDGNKGGTHNVFQQMLEKKKPFWWIEPNSKKIIEV